MTDAEKAGREFQKLVEILDALRGETGCPWDREQDEKSIVSYFLEEVYEVVDALFGGDPRSLAEELGDVLMEVVFLSRIFKEKGKFTISQVMERINRKMIERHPHVFGQAKLDSSTRVIDEWNRRKKEEKERTSLLEGLGGRFPALLEAFLIGQRVSHFGFDWSGPLDALQKTKEEIAELEKALEERNVDQTSGEIGDVFFSLANVSRLCGVNPEIVLKQANKKFKNRFEFIEKRLKERGKELGQASLKEMDEIWEEAKGKAR